ncbi:caspase family protein [Desulfobacterales bacterium HSG16]|nr:caspase family protein [Desulfobacterales bacterium HSG16]
MRTNQNKSITLIEKMPFFETYSLIRKRMVIAVFVVLALLSFGNLVIADEKSEIFPQLGHSLWVNSVTFSPDGTMALSGSGDKTLKLWNIATGKCIRTFTGHSGQIESVVFSPDGYFALSGGSYKDETMKLWEVSTGRCIRTFTGHSGWVKSVAFSPDGQFALSGSVGPLKLWKVSTGKCIRTFTGHLGGVNSVTFSPDGHFALSVGIDGTLKLWEISTGKCIRTFNGNYSVRSVAISPDGSLALTGGADKTLTLWEVTSGRCVRKFTGHSNSITSVEISPDGTMALSGSKGTLKLWNISTGKCIRTFTESTGHVKSVAFSPDGTMVLYGYTNTLKLWDISTNRCVRTFTGHSNSVSSVAFSPDGRMALFGGYPSFKLWDISTGQCMRTFNGHPPALVKSVVFSPDGTLALSCGYYKDKALKLWDLPKGQCVRTLSGHSGRIYSVAFSPDGTLALSGSEDKHLKLWEVSTGRCVRTVYGHSSWGVRSVTFSPDGRKFLSGGCDKSLKLWDVSTGQCIRMFEGHPNNVYSVEFSPDGRMILSGSAHAGNNVDLLKLWEVSTGRCVYTFDGHSDGVNSVAFSPDGTLALSGSMDNTLKLWDISTGRCLRTFTGHLTDVKSVTFSPDGTLALSGSEDHTTRIWNVKTGKEIAKMVSFDDGEWVTITPEGYYNASVNGGKHLNVTIGTNVYSIDQYEETYYRPDIVKLAIKLGNTQTAIAKLQKHIKPVAMAKAQPPKIWFVSPAPSYETTRGYIEVRVKTEDITDTVDSVTFKVNFRPIAKAKVPVRPVRAGKKIREFSKQIPLKIGENWVEAEVKGKHGATRKTTILVMRKGKIKKLPVLYYFGAGVSKHSLNGLSLQYPDKDITGLAEVLKRQKEKVYKNVKAKVLVNEQATRANIIDGVETFFKNANQEDVAIFFISGHGMNSSAGEYHFIAYDTNPDRLSSTGVSWKFFNSLLKKSKASILLFSDTCHSGNIAGNAEWRNRANIDPNEFLRESARAGVFVFSSSSGDTVSREDPSWGHGAFAKALIDGLNGEAAYKKGLVKLSFLQDYVKDTVLELTDNTQQPVIPKLGGAGMLLDLVIAEKM